MIKLNIKLQNDEIMLELNDDFEQWTQEFEWWNWTLTVDDDTVVREHKIA